MTAGAPQPTAGSAHPADILRRIQDRVDIEELVYEYARQLDLFRPDAAAALFTEDGIADFSPSLDGTLRGRPEIAAVMRRALARYTHTSHHVSNLQVRFLESDRATARCYVLAWHRPKDGADATLYGQYEDVLVRRPEGWRFAERREYAAGHVNMRPEWNWIPRASPEG